MQNISSKLHTTGLVRDIAQPTFFDIKDASDKDEFLRFISTERTWVYDHIYGQLKELMKIRHPKQKLKEDDYTRLINEHLNGCLLQEYGVWVYYPWSRNMVHILDKEEFIDLRTAANRQKITYEERNILATKKVGIIGLSVGQSVALTLAMERGCGELRIADFDTIELNNLNRLRTGLHNLGIYKAYTVAREIAEIDPFFKVVCYTDGVTENNIHDFFTKDGKLDLVIDECDGVDVKIRCRIKAKELHVPVLMEASDRGTVDVERYDLEPNRPIMHGWLEHLPIDLDFLKTLKTSEEKFPYILPIAGMETLSTRMKASMLEIEQTITTWPQLASAVALGGAVTADTCRRIFLNQFTASGRYFIDLERLIPEEKQNTTPHVLQILDGVTENEMNQLISSAKIQTSEKQTNPDKTIISELVKAAITAPSGGNAQPWKWRYENKFLYLFLNSEYAPKMIDYANTASYIGLGAATENLIIKAQHLGMDVKYEKFPMGTDKNLVAVFSFYNKNTSGTATIAPVIPFELAPYIEKRVVNRKVTPSQTIQASKLEELVKVAQGVPGAELSIITEPDAINRIGEIMAMADRIRVMNSAGHLEFLAETKWTEEEALKTRKGVDINTLDLTPSEIAGFKIIKNWDVVNYLNDWNGGTGLEKLTKKTADAASAVGLITMPSYSMDNIFEGGRALERVWLAATKHNIAFQPISISVFIFHRYKHEGLTIFSEHVQGEIIEMRKRFEALFPIVENRCEILMFRLFIADNPEKRSLRTNVEEILSFT